MNTFNIAQVYERLGEKEKAIENYTKAFKNPILSVDDNKTHEQVYLYYMPFIYIFRRTKSSRSLEFSQRIWLMHLRR